MGVNSEDRLAKLSVREKLGYGLGDAGFNFYWIIIGSYLMYFYTDIFGISAAAAGTMFLVTKIIDACTDPIIGGIADRTNTRWGKFRPYLLFAGVPMAAAAVLTMTTPDFGETGKLIWVYLTYSAMMLCYTAINMPYNSLAGVITANTEERNSIFGIRFVCAYAIGIVVGTATPSLAESLGGDDIKRGWQLTMLLYSSVATVLFWVCFAATKERVQPPADQNTSPFEDIADLLKNRAWLILFALALILMITLTLRGGSAPYFLKYYMQRPDLLGPYIGLQMASYAISCAVCPFLANRIGKVKLLFGILSVVSVLSILFMFVPKPDSVGVVTLTSETSTLTAESLLGEAASEGDEFRWTEHKKTFWILSERIDLDESSSDLKLDDSKGKVISVVKTSTDAQGNTLVMDSADLPIEIIIVFMFNICISLALGAKSPLTWSMYADAADYNEWKTGRRATAMTFAATTFSQKLGSALGSFCMGLVLMSIGYVANEAQTGASQDGILYLQTLYPGVFAIIAVIALKFYNLDHKKLAEIQTDLAERQAKQA